MTSSRRRALALVALVSLATAASETRVLAQSAGELETARALNKEGKELRAAGKLHEALLKFKAAHDLGRTPVTGIELARTEVLVMQLVEAREVCLGIARLPVADDETERSASARDEAEKLAEELRPRIPSVLVRLSNVPLGRAPTVLIDRVVVPAAAAGEPQKVNPGRHEVAAKIGQGPEESVIVDVREAETKEVPLTLRPEMPVLPPTPSGSSSAASSALPPSSPPSDADHAAHGEAPKKNKLVTVGFTIAGAGIILGSMTGLLAMSKKNNLDALCKGTQCGPDAYDDLDAARTWGTFSTVAFGVGAVGAAIGLYALVMHKDDPRPATRDASSGRAIKPRANVWIGPGSVGVHGSF
jgi:hypothetical protein